MNRQSWWVAVATMVLAVGGCTARRPAAVAAAAATPSVASEQGLRDAVAQALQGDGRAAVARLKPLDPATLSAKNRQTHACMLERLDARRTPPAQLDDRFLAGVLAAYREYWLRSLRSEHPAADNEANLLAALNALAVAEGDAAATNLDDLETHLDARITARGWHALFGLTLPLREFMLWKTETPQHYEAPLPQGVQPVTVVFMDGFASLGWAGFATCDRAHSGGWTRPEALYAVRSAYDLDSEDFRVSYLAHEAQHFWDHAHFPALEQPELEYRAKLVELASGRTGVYDTLDAFSGNVGTDRAVPHSHANGRVVHELRTRLFGGNASAWQQADVERINTAAAQLLREDTQRHAGTPPASATAEPAR